MIFGLAGILYAVLASLLIEFSLRPREITRRFLIAYEGFSESRRRMPWALSHSMIYLMIELSEEATVDWDELAFSQFSQLSQGEHHIEFSIHISTPLAGRLVNSDCTNSSKEFDLQSEYEIGLKARWFTSETEESLLSWQNHKCIARLYSTYITFFNFLPPWNTSTDFVLKKNSCTPCQKMYD